jgi:putative colanic acid biosynthesis acetyltransferase WcaF
MFITGYCKVARVRHVCKLTEMPKSSLYEVDVARNRSAVKWTTSEQMGRILWALTKPFFSYSPRPFFWGWRRTLLRLFGANIGTGVHISPGAHITIPWNLKLGDNVTIGDRVILYALGSIEVGARTTISQGAHLCAGTHDYRDPTRPLLKLPIKLGQDIWVCADAFLGPNIEIGDGAIVGARAVLVKDVAPAVVVAGNPARIVKSR